VTIGSAFWIAAVRARESDRPDRLFADPWARDLAGGAGFETMARSERQAGGENTFIPVRVRWFDDLVLDRVGAGTRQVVLLGAGLDTRAYRLALPADLAWFELDRSAVFTAKDHVLRDVPPTCHRTVVEADVEGDWFGPLCRSGFDPAASALWIAEGLLFYLAEETVSRTLRIAAEGSGPGSRFGADVIGSAGLDSQMMRPYREWCAANGQPPPFGSSDPAGLLSAGGWRPERVSVPGASGANFGRLPDRPDGQTPGSTHLVVGAREAG
jgi:methyltransferase (TIGR00027 family)